MYDNYIKILLTLKLKLPPSLRFNSEKLKQARGIRTLGIVGILGWRGLRALILRRENGDFESHSIPRRHSLNFFSEKFGKNARDTVAESLARLYFKILQVKNFGDWRGEIA